MRLKDHYGGVCDETLYNLWDGLQDHYWARYFVRRVGRAERERFSEYGWAYGDPSYFYGGDVMEVYAHQANVVVKTLFGEALACSLLAYTSDDEELYRFEASLLDGDGLSAFGTREEQLALCGDFHYGGESSTLFAEVSGGAEGIWRLKGALRQAERAPWIFHHDPASERGAGYDRSVHFVLGYECEYYPDRESVHYGFFETLLSAWDAMQAPRNGE